MAPLRVATTTPFDDLAGTAARFAALERLGYDAAFTYETKHDPFLPLALASQATDAMRLGTAIAIAFARTPMLLANIGRDLQELSRGRFVLGLGSQVRPHVTRRYSMPWSRPAARMHELVRALHAIWDAWEDGAPLAFDGEFYRHTLMTPAFDPGPSGHGRPAVHVAGVGPAMTRVAAEVGDGLIVHPFSTRTSLEQLTLPAVEEGLRAAGRDRGQLEVVVVCLVVTGDTGPELDASVAVARRQLAFYASTPAYARVLEVHGWEGMHAELNAMSKQGRWDDMAALVPDEVLESIAVVGSPDEVADRIREKADGIADLVSLENTRNPPADHFARIVAALRG